MAIFTIRMICFPGTLNKQHRMRRCAYGSSGAAVFSSRRLFPSPRCQISPQIRFSVSVRTPLKSDERTKEREGGVTRPAGNGGDSADGHLTFPPEGRRSSREGDAARGRRYEDGRCNAERPAAFPVQTSQPLFDATNQPKAPSPLGKLHLAPHTPPAPPFGHPTRPTSPGHRGNQAGGVDKGFSECGVCAGRPPVGAARSGGRWYRCDPCFLLWHGASSSTQLTRTPNLAAPGRLSAA